MYPIADMLVQIKNAQATGASQVETPFSKTKMTIASLLKSAGYLEHVERTTKKGKKSEHEYLTLMLRYVQGVPAISGVKIISTPSRHLYIKAHEIRPVRSGYGAAVVSTPEGIMMAKEAKKKKLGGEMLFEIW